MSESLTFFPHYCLILFKKWGQSNTIKLTNQIHTIKWIDLKCADKSFATIERNYCITTTIQKKIQGISVPRNFPCGPFWFTFKRSMLKKFTGVSPPSWHLICILSSLSWIIRLSKNHHSLLFWPQLFSYHWPYVLIILFQTFSGSLFSRLLPGEILVSPPLVHILSALRVSVHILPFHKSWSPWLIHSRQICVLWTLTVFLSYSTLSFYSWYLVKG